MTSPEGGFYSSQDADSEGEEGTFYVWTPDEVRAVLGDEEAALFNRYFDITPEGNFEGRNILHVARDLEVAAREFGVSVDRLRAVIDEGRRKLFEARSHRVWPGRDEKILTAWNGLMLHSFAEAGRALDRADYLEAARRNAEFLLYHLLREYVTRAPSAFGRLLGALDFYLSTPKEIAPVGDPDRADMRALLAVVYGRYLPNKVVALRRADEARPADLIPLLSGRPPLDGRATAYVCEHYACQMPTTDPEELARQLG